MLGGADQKPKFRNNRKSPSARRTFNAAVMMTKAPVANSNRRFGAVVVGFQNNKVAAPNAATAKAAPTSECASQKSMGDCIVESLNLRRNAAEKVVMGHNQSLLFAP